MSEQLELFSAVMSETKQAEENPIRKWVRFEPSVWTESMRNALYNGVKGGKWFSLIDKVYQPANLYSAFDKVEANKGTAGVDHASVKDFRKSIEWNIQRIHDVLKVDKYSPQAILRVEIPKPGSREKRPLGIPHGA